MVNDNNPCITDGCRSVDGRTIVIPNHPGEEIDRGLLNKIIKKKI